MSTHFTCDISVGNSTVCDLFKHRLDICFAADRNRGGFVRISQWLFQPYQMRRRFDFKPAVKQMNLRFLWASLEKEYRRLHQGRYGRNGANQEFPQLPLLQKAMAAQGGLEQLRQGIRQPYSVRHAPAQRCTGPY